MRVVRGDHSFTPWIRDLPLSPPLFFFKASYISLGGKGLNSLSKPAPVLSYIVPCGSDLSLPVIAHGFLGVS